jgi:hypothetical protein
MGQQIGVEVRLPRGAKIQSVDFDGHLLAQNPLGSFPRGFVVSAVSTPTYAHPNILFDSPFLFRKLLTPAWSTRPDTPMGPPVGIDRSRVTTPGVRETPDSGIGRKIGDRCGCRAGIINHGVKSDFYLIM